MKSHKNLFFTALTLLALMAGAWAQIQTASTANPDTGYPAAVATPPPVTAADIAELKAALAAQQREIQAPGLAFRISRISPSNTRESFGSSMAQRAMSRRGIWGGGVCFFGETFTLIPL